MRPSVKTIRSAISAVLAIACAAGALAAAPSSGIAVIWAYNGTWQTQSESFDTVHSKAGHDKATLHNSCWMDGAYLACNQYVDGDSKVLLVFTYSEKDKSYTSYQIPSDGGMAGKGKLTIEGNVWTFPWQTTEGSATTYYRVVNTFTTPAKIEYRREFSTDNIHWTLMARGTTVKISDK
jgi:hypothetical protein